MRKIGLPGLIICLLLAGCGKAEDNKAHAKAAPPKTTEQRLAAPPDLKRGERLFLECAVCHERAKGAPHRVGPTLWGVFGHPAASRGDFAYSTALRNAGLVWDEPTLGAYLENPQGLVPGNRMAFAGEANEADRRDLIAYLKSLQD